MMTLLFPWTGRQVSGHGVGRSCYEPILFQKVNGGRWPVTSDTATASFSPHPCMCWVPLFCEDLMGATRVFDCSTVLCTSALMSYVLAAAHQLNATFTSIVFHCKQTSTSLTALVKLQPRTALLLPSSKSSESSPAYSGGKRTSWNGVDVCEIDASLVQVKRLTSNY